MQRGGAESLAEALAGVLELGGQAAGEEPDESQQRQAEGQDDGDIAVGCVGHQPLAHLQGGERQHLGDRERGRPAQRPPPAAGCTESSPHTDDEHQRQPEEGDKRHRVERRGQVLMAGVGQ